MIRLRPPVAIAVVGLLITTLLGSGLLATTTDTATIRDNTLGSGAVGDGVDILVGRTDDGSCPSRFPDAYSDAPAGIELTVDPDDFDETGVLYPGFHDLCIRNVGPMAVTLTLLVVVTLDAEDGACEPDEEAAGDSTCVDGNDGELAEAVQVEVAPHCVDNGGDQTAGLSDVTVFDLGTLPPGEECNLGVFLSVPIEDHLLWQTDLVVYDLVVEAVAASPGP